MSHNTQNEISMSHNTQNKALVLSAAFAAAIVSLGAVSPAMAQKSLDIKVTTSPSPTAGYTEHILAVWIEDAAGAFIATIKAVGMNDTRKVWVKNYLSAGGSADAITGPTIKNHDAPFTTTWDLLDSNGVEIPAGDYTIMMETADKNNPDPNENNLGSFPFTKGPASETTNPPDDNGFSAVTFKLTLPNAANCGNGMIDSGETCDSAATGKDACLTECPDTTGDACMPNVLSGAAATCDARCAIVEVTTCADGDGCCPEGCTVDGDKADSDCVGGGGNGNNLEGGCSSSGGATGLGALLLLGLAVFFIRRRRQSVTN